MLCFQGGLAEEVDEKVLHAAFIPFGDIIDIQIPLDYETGEKTQQNTLSLEHTTKHYSKIVYHYNTNRTRTFMNLFYNNNILMLACYTFTLIHLADAFVQICFNTI